MITNFIKEVIKFYWEVYRLNLKDLSLERLKDLNSRFKSFHSHPVLRRRNTEEEKLHSFLASEVLSRYFYFYAKNSDASQYFSFLHKVIACLKSNPESLKEIILKQLNIVKLPVNRTVASYTVINNYDRSIIFEADLDSYNYLYYYGCNVTDNEIKTVDYFNTVSEDKLASMAQCIAEAFLRGLEKSSVDVSQKDYAIFYYPVGFEKLAKKVSMLFDGQLKLIFKAEHSSFDRQLSYDHRYDYVLYRSQSYVNSYLSCFENALKAKARTFSKFAGTIRIRTFGKDRFIPKNGSEIFAKNKELAVLNRSFNTEFNILYDKYIDVDTSFTIISYPCPEIGKDFENIFDDTLTINSLDNDKYEKIQQRIIDTLDTAKYVHITGKNGNKTDLTVALVDLPNPDTQTLFENCCADMNVPVGEVFTSPKLQGTNGILHVSEIYLRGWKFIDLFLRIQDGIIVQYSCKNFSTEEENKEYINEHLLFDNETLPMGEFAIGTNTLAYVMGNKYGINSKLDILIAEKTGPHFAFGNTCYAMSENVKVFNSDGKEMIAKDNDFSILRTTDMSKAYFGVHTDVTIPYYELGDIVAVCGDENITIIKDGRFVLEGTEELNVDGM